MGTIDGSHVHLEAMKGHLRRRGRSKFPDWTNQGNPVNMSRFWHFDLTMVNKLQFVSDKYSKYILGCSTV